MIHEGLVLEYSGWQLALMNLATQIRQLCFLLLASFLLPAPIGKRISAWVACLQSRSRSWKRYLRKSGSSRYRS